jgi:hypothetical protein
MLFSFLVTLAYDFMLKIHTLCNKILLSINKVYIFPSFTSCYLDFYVMIVLSSLFTLIFYVNNHTGSNSFRG